MKVARLLLSGGFMLVAMTAAVPGAQAEDTPCTHEPVFETCVEDWVSCFVSGQGCQEPYAPIRNCVFLGPDFCPEPVPTLVNNCPDLESPCPVYTEAGPDPECVAEGLCDLTRRDPQLQFVFFDNPVPDVTIWVVPCWYPSQYAIGALFLPQVNVEDACIVGLPPVDDAGPMDDSIPVAPCAEVPAVCADERRDVDIEPTVDVPGLCAEGERLFILGIYITTIGFPQVC